MAPTPLVVSSGLPCPPHPPSQGSSGKSVVPGYPSRCRSSCNRSSLDRAKGAGQRKYRGQPRRCEWVAWRHRLIWRVCVGQPVVAQRRQIRSSAQAAEDPRSCLGIPLKQLKALGVILGTRVAAGRLVLTVIQILKALPGRIGSSGEPGALFLFHQISPKRAAESRFAISFHHQKRDSRFLASPCND